MKTVLKSLCYFVATLMMITSYHASYAGNTLPTAKGNTIFSVVVNKNVNSKKHKVVINADADHENILFTVNGIDGKNYQLFVFDMQSTLVTQATIQNHKTSVLNNLAKGNYLFEVLIDDEKIESGRLTIK